MIFVSFDGHPSEETEFFRSIRQTECDRMINPRNGAEPRTPQASEVFTNAETQEIALLLARSKLLDPSEKTPPPSNSNCSMRFWLQVAATDPRPDVRENVPSEIQPDAVILEQDGSRFRLANDAVIVCAGGVLPTGLLRDMGVTVVMKYGEP
jgi:hypothetical protein